MSNGFQLTIVAIFAGFAVIGGIKSCSNGFGANSVRTTNFDPDDITYIDDRANGAGCLGVYGYQRGGEVIGSSSIGAFSVACDSLDPEILKEQNRWVVNPKNTRHVRDSLDSAAVTQEQMANGVYVSPEILEDNFFVGDDVGDRDCKDFTGTTVDLDVIADVFNANISKLPMPLERTLSAQQITGTDFLICAGDPAGTVLSSTADEIIITYPDNGNSQELADYAWDAYQNLFDMANQ